MTTPTLIIYDDGRGRFGPMTDLRAVFEIRTGASPSRHRIERSLGRPADELWVPRRLVDCVREREPGLSVNLDHTGGDACLLVNGRWTGLRFAREVNRLEMNQAVVQADGQMLAACLGGHETGGFLKGGCLTLPDRTRAVRVQTRALLDRPWHILDELPANLLADLSASQVPEFQSDDHPGATVLGNHTVRVGPGVRLMPTVVIDAGLGPVIVERDAVVNPFVVLQGPCYIGPGTALTSHASVRRNTVIGSRCKIGGEVSASIIHDHTNKAHGGFLGDSLVGSWVNLGADTNGSNLKNTYGHVRVQLDQNQPAQDTGRTFHGAILGDFVRTAIGTRLPTGAVIHTGCMLAVTGWAPRLAPPLGFHTDTGPQPYDPKKLISTLRTVMARRDARLTGAQERLVRSLAESG
jgi:UDP-N-acetylglucosamine diphosphorylase/glucosamine-1-phosphate N-acetyltransferase